MNYYKGIDLDRNTNLYSYIQTYYKEDYELREAHMEVDTGLQRIVTLHYLEIKLYKIAFNLGVYAMFYGVYILIQG